MANVYMVVKTPDEKLKSFLRYLQDYDGDVKDGISVIEVIVHAPNLGESEVEAMFKELRMPYAGKVQWVEKAAKMEWRPEN